MSNFWDNDPVEAAPSSGNFWDNDPVDQTASAAAASSGTIHNLYTGAADIASKVPYLSDAANAVGTAFNRVGANLPFADRATALASSELGSGDYNSNLAAIRAYDAQRWKEHPWQERAATVAGAFLPALGAVGKVAQGADLASTIPSLANSMWRGGVMGGGYGLTSGASDVQDYRNMDSSDAWNIAKKGVEGAVTGAGLPVVGKVVGDSYRAFKNAPYRVVAGMEEPAQNKVISALQYDQPTSQDWVRVGPDGNLLDVSPSAHNTALGIATGPASQAKTEMMRDLEARNRGAYGNASAALDANLGQAETPGQFATRIKPTLNQIKAPEDIALAARNNGTQISTAPIMANLADAMSRAEGNDAVTKALSSVKNGLMKPVLDGNGKPILQPNGKPLLTQETDPLVLHNVKKSFDNLIDYPEQTLGVSAQALKQKGGPIMTFRGQLNEALGNAMPGYKQANEALSSSIGQQENFELGRNLLSGSTKNAVAPEDFSPAYAGLNPVNQGAQSAGARSSLNAILGVPGNGPNVRNPMGPLTKAFNGNEGWNQRNLGVMFGDQPVQNVADVINAGKIHADTYNKLYQGSKTAESAAAQGANAVPAQPGNVIPRVPQLPGSAGYVTGGLNAAGAVGNKAINAFRNAPMVDNAARNLQMVQGAFLPRGQAGQAVVKALLDANAGRVNNAATADALVKALMGTGAGATVNFMRGQRGDQQ